MDLKTRANVFDLLILGKTADKPYSFGNDSGLHFNAALHGIEMRPVFGNGKIIDRNLNLMMDLRNNFVSVPSYQ
jgi:hypothetical protein